MKVPSLHKVFAVRKSKSATMTGYPTSFSGVTPGRRLLIVAGTPLTLAGDFWGKHAKIGGVPVNTRGVGRERIDRDGYLLRKVDE